MTDRDYQPLVYRKQGGNEMVVASGGLIRCEPGGMFVGPNPSGGADFWAAANALVDGDGSSFNSPFKTMAEALAASHAWIGSSVYRAWACRNRIFAVGDGFVENMTKLAQKTDVIGLGQCDGFGPGARIVGNHIIDTGTTLGTTLTPFVGTRFFNVAFKDAASTGTIFTAAQTQAALAFIGCDFLTGTATVVGLLATAVTDLLLRGCRFVGSWGSSWSTAAISIGTGSGNRTLIEDCAIGNTHASGVGILVNSGHTSAGSFIRNNHIVTTAMAIDENSNMFFVVGNRIIVGTAKAAETSVDISLAKAADNIVTGSDGTVAIPACNYGAQS